MSITSLIKKYGEKAKQNGVDISVFVDAENTVSSYKKETKYNIFTGINTLSILTKNQIEDTDVFNISGLQYRVLKSNGIRKNGINIYFDVLLFEDDFIHDIEILKQSLNSKGCNLPSIYESETIVLKGRIKTTAHNEYLQYAMHSNKVPTHIISVLFDGSAIEITDLIKWNNRSFEVLGSENINEQNKILVINAIEVLNG